MYKASLGEAKLQCTVSLRVGKTGLHELLQSGKDRDVISYVFKYLLV